MSSIRILVVDDEVLLAQTFVRALAAAGYDCLVAHDGPTALKLLDAEHPELLLVDVYLPSPGGLEIARCAQAKLPGTKIIVMTAFSTPSLERDALKAGAAAYLRKPFSNAELLAAVKRAVPQRP